MRSGALSRAASSLADIIHPESAPVLWTPLPGPQTEAYYSKADELFYGGAAGGGKSDLLLGLAMTAHTKSVLFRREFPQSADLMERAAEIAGIHGKMRRGSPGKLTLPGRTVSFGSCPHEQNKLRWQGRPHDLKGFDEITHFTRSIFVFLKTWARTQLQGQQVRVVATGNPPTTAEGAWVREYWGPWLDSSHPNPAVPGELRWFVTSRDGTTDIETSGPDPIEVDGEILHPRSRTFIPALLSDNPYLSSDAEYLAVIQSLPEPLRSQMLYGDFDVDTSDDRWQVIPSEWYDMAVVRWEKNITAVGELSAVGVDVARGGGDRTVLAAKHGQWFAEPTCIPGVECSTGREVAGAVVAMTSRTSEPVVIGIDVIGVGASPYDMLTEMGAAISGINFGEGTEAVDRSGKYRMKNVRAAAYWGFREALDPEHSQIALPPNKALRAEMLSPRWKLAGSRIQIESKDEIISRLGRSPDLADAIVLAWYVDRNKSLEFW